MNKALAGLALGTAIVVATSTISVVTFAEEKEYQPKAVATALLEGPLAGVEGKTVIIKNFRLPPGHVGGKHTHPGTVFVYVFDGSLTIETSDGKSQTVSAGELYPEPMGLVMQARNTSTAKGVEIVVFQIGTECKPMMVKAD